MDCIDDEDTTDELERDLGRSGRAVLVYIEAEVQKVSASSSGYDQLILDRFDKRLKAGIMIPSVKAFSSFKSDLKRERRELSSSAEISDKLGDATSAECSLELHVLRAARSIARYAQELRFVGHLRH